jgi:hypothetical protein
VGSARQLPRVKGRGKSARRFATMGWLVERAGSRAGKEKGKGVSWARAAWAGGLVAHGGIKG